MEKQFDYGLISQHISRLLGLHFPEKYRESMGRNVMKAAIELKRNTSPEEIHQWLKAQSLKKEDFDALARHLSIGETYFFRENTALELLTDNIIPWLIAQSHQRQVRIWSAGCSSGEEPYSLAMLLREHVSDIDRRPFKIIGTDINPGALQKAKKGLYTSWSFRNTPEYYKKKYFAQRGKAFEIHDDIKKMVHFRQLNLAQANYPSLETDTMHVDVIFCRNVLMYFLPEVAIHVARRFYEALNQNGWLITSQVELHEDFFGAFQRIRFKGCVYYRKSLDQTGTKDIAAPIDSRRKTERANQQTTSHRTPAKEKASNAAKAARKKNFVADKPVSLPAMGRPFSLSRAKTLYAETKYRACADYCIRHLESHSVSKEIADLLIKSLANSGQLDQARVWAEKVLSSYPEDAGSLNLYATILMEQGNNKLAEKVLVRALYVDSIYPAALFNMYCVLSSLGKDKMARKYFENLQVAIRHISDEDFIPGLESVTAGVVRNMV